MTAQVLVVTCNGQSTAYASPGVEVHYFDFNEFQEADSLEKLQAVMELQDFKPVVPDWLADILRKELGDAL